jgi:hypothetical protein
VNNNGVYRPDTELTEPVEIAGKSAGASVPSGFVILPVLPFAGQFSCNAVFLQHAVYHAAHQQALAAVQEARRRRQWFSSYGAHRWN